MGLILTKLATKYSWVKEPPGYRNKGPFNSQKGNDDFNQCYGISITLSIMLIDCTHNCMILR